MRSLRPIVLVSLLTLPVLGGCAGRSPYATLGSESGLELDSVVLYRNGVAYFERRGRVDGQILRLRVRKDQVNDLLKSLTIVDEDGKAVSVSMPLDPQTWASAAMATLAPGRGSLPMVLDSLRGTEVTVRSNNRYIRGRIVLVERTINEPDPDASSGRSLVPMPAADSRDWKLTVLSRGQMQVVRLSTVKSISLHDGDLAMQLHRSLDASAGEGMFEQVDVEVRLIDARSHRLVVSYVVGAPMWKPTYRVVLPKEGKGEALLQGWAVVDNVSGEDWERVALSLTSGAPISFRYDLHTPREVPRTDMSHSGVDKRAAVALGETSFDQPEEVMPAAEPEPDYYGGGEYGELDDFDEEVAAEGWGGPGGGGGGRSASTTRAPRGKKEAERWKDADRSKNSELRARDYTTTVDIDTLRRSTMAAARSQRIAGLTRVDLTDPVTVPDGTSTMVALINESVAAEQTFLFKPGGAGYGYEQNPYRVLRFTNSTAYVLEPGPISIYSGGSFVGEGLSEAVGAGTSVTIPFAVEAGISVSSSRTTGQEMNLTRIVRGVLEVETYYQTTTSWEVRGAAKPEAYTVLIRQPQTGSNYSLAKRPEGTEDLEGAWLIPVKMAAKATKGTVDVVEQTPSTMKLEIWDPQAPALLDKLLAAGTLDASARAKLQPVVDLRRAIGKIDTEINGLHRQVAKNEQRAEETRQDLKSLEKNNSANARKLRAKLVKRLDEFSSEAAGLGRKILELENTRLEKVIELEDLLENLDLKAAATPE